MCKTELTENEMSHVQTANAVISAMVDHLKEKHFWLTSIVSAHVEEFRKSNWLQSQVINLHAIYQACSSHKSELIIHVKQFSPAT